MLPVAERRIAVGGYRLANVLKNMDLTTAWAKSSLVEAPVSKPISEADVVASISEPSPEAEKSIEVIQS